jgi:hypothetical protein
MIVYAWLAVNENGRTKLTKSKPTLQGDEIAISLKLDIPNALFRKPSLEAVIKIPDSVAQTELLTSAVVDNIEQILKSNFNLDIKVNKIEDDGTTE